jgi:hypothetical protein
VIAAICFTIVLSGCLVLPMFLSAWKIPSGCPCPRCTRWYAEQRRVGAPDAAPPARRDFYRLLAVIVASAVGGVVSFAAGAP